MSGELRLPYVHTTERKATRFPYIFKVRDDAHPQATTVAVATRSQETNSKRYERLVTRWCEHRVSQHCFPITSMIHFVLRYQPNNQSVRQPPVLLTHGTTLLLYRSINKFNKISALKPTI